MVSLDATVEVRRGTFALAVELAVGAGEVVAVLGPSGAGKTTLLGALAGLIPLDAGRVVLDGAVLEDPAAGARVPPERRPIGMVFQAHRLFPHLSARANVAFGLRSRGVPARRAAAEAAAWLERLGLAAEAERRPAALSGGQAQRVALARALAPAPRLLLLDEPLAALDVRTRAEVRRTLRRVLADFRGVRLLVTHDPLEAWALADRLVILEAGRIVQSGTPAEVTARPRSRWVADLAGVNLVQGRAASDVVTLANGHVLRIAEPADGDVLAVVHPRAVVLHRSRPEGSPRNCWQAVVASLDDEGTRVRVELAGPLPLVAEVTRAAVAELALAAGVAVWASVKATEIATYAA